MYSLDRSDMFGRIYDMPDHMRIAAASVHLSGVKIKREGLRQLVVSGLGGSAVGGELLRSYAGAACPLPILVNRHYLLPAFLDAATCLLAVSYSGNTEETLSAYEQAKEAGAQIIAITSGGELKRRADRDGFPVLLVPGGLQPRAALGYLFVPQLFLLEGAGLLPSVSEDFEETISVLQTLRDEFKPSAPQDANGARMLARRIKGRIPIIHAPAGPGEGAAYRWKTQINENAQSLAFAHVYPELNHNEIVGFDVPEPLLPQIEVVTLHTGHVHPQVRKRIELTTRSVLDAKGISRSDVHARGESALAQLFSLVLTGDYVSAYLALEYGLDPTPVQVITDLKNKLAE